MKNCFVFRAHFGVHPGPSAFSLVEMLMALLVASLLLAALAPVMTRRFGDNVNVSAGSAVAPKAFCAYANDNTTVMLLDTEDKGCMVPDGTYSAGAIIASGGGGGGAAADIVKSNDYYDLVTTINTGTSDARDEKAFNRYVKDMVVKITGGGGGGGGGNYYIPFLPKSQADCEPFGVYISSERNKALPICVSKYNPGDIYFAPSAANKYASPAIPSGVTQAAPGGTCSNGYCCWKPRSYSQYTSGDSSGTFCHNAGTGVITSGFNGSNYSGCFRTVCQWRAANLICANWNPTGNSYVKGRLPKTKEMRAWTDTGLLQDAGGKPPVMNWVSTGGQGSGYGLQLCNEWNTTGGNTGTQRCNPNGNCLGAGANAPQTNACYPPLIWAQDTSVSGQHTALYYSAGRASAGVHYYDTVAFSVRCAVGGDFYPHIGGGGSSGIFASVKVPDRVIIRATEDGKNGTVRTYAGAGGTGGNKQSTSKGTNGTRSFVEILDSNKQRIWSLRVSGGNSAAGASESAGGEAGEEVPALCDYFDITDDEYSTEKKGMECNKIPGIISSGKGLKGVSGEDASSEKGYGGASLWEGKLSDKTIAGANGTVPGTGGGGGTCTLNDEKPEEPLCHAGGNGAGGAVSVTYKKIYPGVGGGGGAAGTVLHIKNFQVRPKDLIKVKVGERGRGGAHGANGENGGNSYIELMNGTKYEVLGGGGGKAGTAGNFNVNPAIAPVAGQPGTASALSPSTKSRLSSKDEYFPEDSRSTIGTKGIDTVDALTSAGGNGGVNYKISPLVDTKEGTPCGGKSTAPVVFKDTDDNITEWTCNNASNVPLPLSRVLSSTSLEDDVLTALAPGSTGGGGGAWDSSSTQSPASSGANGLGGYVIIYFGEW